MKTETSFLVIVFMLLTFAGLAAAREMSGEVAVVDTTQAAFTVKNGPVEVKFECEKSDVMKNVKVGDEVTVEYREDGVRKIAITVTPAKMKPAGPD